MKIYDDKRASIKISYYKSIALPSYSRAEALGIFVGAIAYVGFLLWIL
jgi:hypothetical protein